MFVAVGMKGHCGNTGKKGQIGGPGIKGQKGDGGVPGTRGKKSPTLKLKHKFDARNTQNAVE